MKVIRVYTILIGILLCCSLSAGQSPRPTNTTAEPAFGGQVGSIKGRVVLENGSFISQAVRITLSSTRGTQAGVYTDNQGAFEFGQLTPGEYTIEIEGDRLLYEVSSEDVEVRRGAPTVVTITLKEKTASNTTRPVGRITSVSELSNDVPAKARKEFTHASALAKEGKANDAIEGLRKAIAVYPNFMMAHNDLGALLMEQGRLDEAAAEFERALQLDSKAFNPNLNLGIARLRQQRFAEAVASLRQAVSLDSNAPAARLYLGIALQNTDSLDDAEHELRSAYELGGVPYAEALFHLGNLYMNKGQRELARQAFEAYVRSAPQAAYAAQARQLISVLR
jgi:tetratricopeptide (TPR) repeat protein